MTEENKKTHYTLEDVPEEVRPFIGDPAFIPTPEEVGALERLKPLKLEGLQSQANVEIDIIRINAGNRLAIVWGVDTRGITIGARLYLFGWRHDLGSATINPDSPKVEIKGPWILGYQATVSAGVETARCELFVSAKLVCGWPVYRTLDNRLALQYAIPWPAFQPGWVEAVTVTKEMADNIKNAPARQYRQPRPGFVQRDPVTTAAVQTLMWLVGAGGYVEQVRRYANEAAALDAGVDPKKLLFALGVAGQAGIGVGVEGAAGIYITGGGEVGWFGSGAIDIGPFLSIAAGIAVYVFWTGTEGFGGVSMGISVGVGKSLGPECPVGVGVNCAIYWSLGEPQSAVPSGFCVQLTIGFSPIPIQGYASFGYTYIHKLLQVWGSSLAAGLQGNELPPAVGQTS